MRRRSFFIIQDPSGGVEVQLRDNIKLDYESWNKTNTCIIIATDKGSPVLSANATVEINLTDENDNAPKVNYTPIRGNITRFADPGTTVIYKINATDADSGRNKEIEFKTSNFFLINFLIFISMHVKQLVVSSKCKKHCIIFICYEITQMY